MDGFKAPSVYLSVIQMRYTVYTILLIYGVHSKTRTEIKQFLQNEVATE